MTYRRRRWSCVHRLVPWLRAEARTCARGPAENARDPLFPLLCCPSRATVLGARPNRRAMAESPVPCARPRLISSRSADDSRQYRVVVCIRIHRTYIRCGKCLTPSSEYASSFFGPQPRIYQQLLCLATKDYSDRLLAQIIHGGSSRNRPSVCSSQSVSRRQRSNTLIQSCVSRITFHAQEQGIRDCSRSVLWIIRANEGDLRHILAA
jgi:hypothetical protein